jgi:hypothetical protein
MYLVQNIIPLEEKMLESDVGLSPTITEAFDNQLA